MQGYVQNDGSLALGSPVSLRANESSYTSVIASKLKRTLTSIPDFAVSLAGDLTDLVGAAIGKQNAGQVFYNAYSGIGLTNEAKSAAEKIATAYHQSKGRIGLEEVAALTRQYSGGRNPVRRAIAQELVSQGVVDSVSDVYTHEIGAKTRQIGGQEFVVGYYDPDSRFGSLMKNISSETWTGLIVGGAATGGASAVGSYLARRAAIESVFGVASKNITDSHYFGESSQTVARTLERTGKLFAYSPTFGLLGMGAEALARAGKNIGKGDSKTAKTVGAAAEYVAFGAELAMAASLVDLMTGNNAHQYIGETAVGKAVAEASKAVNSVPDQLKDSAVNVAKHVDNILVGTAYAQADATAQQAAQSPDTQLQDSQTDAQKLILDSTAKQIAVAKEVYEKLDPLTQRGFTESGYKLDQHYALGKTAPVALDADGWTAFTSLGNVAKDGIVTQKEFDSLSAITQKGFEAAGIKIGTEYTPTTVEPAYLDQGKWAEFNSIGTAAKDGIVTQKEFDGLSALTQKGFETVGFKVGTQYAAEKAVPYYLNQEQWTQFLSLGNVAKDGIVTQKEFDKLPALTQKGFETVGFKVGTQYAAEKAEPELLPREKYDALASSFATAHNTGKGMHTDNGAAALPSINPTINSATQLQVTVPEALRGEHNYVVLSMDMVNYGQESNLGWERLYIPVQDGNVNINLEKYGLAGNDFKEEAWNLRVVQLDNIVNANIAGLAPRGDSGAYFQDTNGFLDRFENEVTTAKTLEFKPHHGRDDSLLWNKPLEYTGNKLEAATGAIVLDDGNWHYPSAKEAGGKLSDLGELVRYDRSGNYDFVPAIHIVGESVGQPSTAPATMQGPIGKVEPLAPSQHVTETTAQITPSEESTVPTYSKRDQGFQLYGATIIPHAKHQLDPYSAADALNARLQEQDFSDFLNPNKDMKFNISEGGKLMIDVRGLPADYTYQFSLEAQQQPKTGEFHDDVILKQGFWNKVGHDVLHLTEEKDKIVTRGSILNDSERSAKFPGLDTLIHKNEGFAIVKMPQWYKPAHVEGNGLEFNRYDLMFRSGPDNDHDGIIDAGAPVTEQDIIVDVFNKSRHLQGIIEAALIVGPAAYNWGYDRGFHDGANSVDPQIFFVPGRTRIISGGELVGGDLIGDGLGGGSGDVITDGADLIGDGIVKILK